MLKDEQMVGEIIFIACIRRRKARNPERDKPMRISQVVLDISVMQEERTQDPGWSKFMKIAMGRLNIAVHRASTGTGTDWNITWCDNDN